MSLDFQEIRKLGFSGQQRLIKKAFGRELTMKERFSLQVQSPDGKRISFASVRFIAESHTDRCLVGAFGPAAAKGPLKIVLPGEATRRSSTPQAAHPPTPIRQAPPNASYPSALVTTSISPLAAANSAEAWALKVVNAGRRRDDEPPLSSLPHPTTCRPPQCSAESMSPEQFALAVSAAAAKARGEPPSSSLPHPTTGRPQRGAELTSPEQFALAVSAAAAKARGESPLGKMLTD